MFSLLSCLHTFLNLLLFLALLRFIFAHGVMTEPSQRGLLSPFSRVNPSGQFPLAPIDFHAHFPAGNKSTSPGAAHRSQQASVFPQGWTPFEPLRKDFRWRAGVCGDLREGPHEHLKGGKYYFNATIVRNYTQGKAIEIEMNIVANHNGFVELHLCDVKNCGGEISEKCFRDGFCRQLQRAQDKNCDSGFDLRCAPIDPNFPGRWYLPCRRGKEGTFEKYGGEKMKYKLPEDLVCEHCVLQWFWSTANNCNPVGVVEFYEGEHGPKNWGQCEGQAGAKGGYTKVQKNCGVEKFAEEYLQCADVRIIPRTRSAMQTEQNSKECGQRSAVFQKFVLYGDDKLVRELKNDDIVQIRNYSMVTISVETFTDVAGSVRFFIDGKLVWIEEQKPYVLYGNVGTKLMYGPQPPKNKPFKITVTGGGEEFCARLTLLQ